MAFMTIVQQRADALLVTAGPFFIIQAGQLIARAACHAVPTSYFWRELVGAGSLMSCGISFTEA
jgi:hypothetical protein